MRQGQSSCSVLELIWSGKKPDAALNGPAANIVLDGLSRASIEHDLTRLAETDGTMEAAAS